MQGQKRTRFLAQREENTRPNVTSAVGLGETTRRQRARRSSLFTQTVIGVTGLICLAFLLGALAQAWSNSGLMQRVQSEQQHTQQLQAYNSHLQQVANHYKDPFVIESEARQELGYSRPGEHSVVIISPNVQPKSSSSQSKSASTQQGFWQEWWNAFFGK